MISLTTNKMEKTMRRSATEVIRNLESRIARLERQAGRKHPAREALGQGQFTLFAPFKDKYGQDGGGRRMKTYFMSKGEIFNHFSTSDDIDHSYVVGMSMERPRKDQVLIATDLIEIIYHDQGQPNGLRRDEDILDYLKSL